MSFTSDPMFQLGMALGGAYGNIWANNATKRQGAKADRIIEDMQNANAIERIANMGTVPAQNGDAGREYANKLIQQQAAGIGVDSGINFGGNPNQYMASMADIKTPSGGLEYSLANVDEDKKYLAKLSPYAQQAANWNPNYTEDNVRKELQRAGLAKDVVDEKVGEVKSDIAKRAEAVLLPSIQKKMFYGYDTVEQTKDEQGNVVPVNVHHDPDANSYMQAMSELELLKQYSPEAYKTYASQMVGSKDLYNERMYEKHFDKQVKVARENAAQNRQWNREDKDIDFKRRVVLAGMKSYGKGNSKNSISTSDYKEALKRMGEIEAYYEEHRSADPNFTLPSSMQEEWEELNAMKTQYRRERTGGGSNSNNNSTDGETPVDWNDWNSIMTGIDQAKADGHSAKDILALVEKKLGKDHPWYKNIASSFNHDVKRKEEEDEAERQQRLNKTLFPNPDVNTVDQTIAKIAGVGSDIANGRPIWNLAHR